ncbi:MAG: DUF2568 domain-containing protein [Paracoccaceae bacterium]|nr:DUF2568 domain-containing protein [Paracoccaceae bacterium]
MHTANLALRLLLEVAALGGFTTLVWNLSAGYWKVFAAIAVVIAIGAIWAIFAVPDDPSRSGKAPVPVPGALRLVLELAILFGGAWAFHASGFSWTGLALGFLVNVHYLLWTDRIVWLLQN